MTWEIGKKNRDNGWFLGSEKLPDSGKHIYTYFYYDGPHYQIWYIDSNRKYWDDTGENDYYSDECLINANEPWRYLEEFHD